MVQKMELILSLETKAQRKLIRLRLDGGFGTDENINYALWRHYHLLDAELADKGNGTLSLF